ncbi:hypothetical protein AGR8A_Cc30104 [Agrobacterium fabrum str. J-07]|nr:hypothetical protein AGR8A_Cc30104 [Agrobacterium fabrum str. J-07]
MFSAYFFAFSWFLNIAIVKNFHIRAILFLVLHIEASPGGRELYASRGAVTPGSCKFRFDRNIREGN